MQDRNTLVFLPGFGFSANLFKPLSEHFSGYKILLLELPANNDINIDTLVDKLCPQIPKHAVIIGWSLGGLIALKLAEKYPENCQALIMLASTPKFLASEDWPGITRTNALQFQNSATENLSLLMQQFIKLVAYPEKKRAIYDLLKNHSLLGLRDHQLLLNDLTLLMRSDFRTLYQSLTLPILFLLGENDAIVPATTAAALSKITKKTSLIRMINAGHALLLSHPVEIAREIVEFIKCTSLINKTHPYETEN